MLNFILGLVIGALLMKVLPALYERKLKKPLYDKIKGVFDE